MGLENATWGANTKQYYKTLGIHAKLNFTELPDFGSNKLLGCLEIPLTSPPPIHPRYLLLDTFSGLLFVGLVSLEIPRRFLGRISGAKTDAHKLRIIKGNIAHVQVFQCREAFRL